MLTASCLSSWPLLLPPCLSSFPSPPRLDLPPLPAVVAPPPLHLLPLQLLRLHPSAFSSSWAALPALLLHLRLGLVASSCSTAPVLLCRWRCLQGSSSSASAGHAASTATRLRSSDKVLSWARLGTAHPMPICADSKITS